jgi:hypothetical protein
MPAVAYFLKDRKTKAEKEREREKNEKNFQTIYNCTYVVKYHTSNH